MTSRKYETLLTPPPVLPCVTLKQLTPNASKVPIPPPPCLHDIIQEWFLSWRVFCLCRYPFGESSISLGFMGSEPQLTQWALRSLWMQFKMKERDTWKQVNKTKGVVYIINLDKYFECQWIKWLQSTKSTSWDIIQYLSYNFTYPHPHKHNFLFITLQTKGHHIVDLKKLKKKFFLLLL